MGYYCIAKVFLVYNRDCDWMEWSKIYREVLGRAIEDPNQECGFCFINVCALRLL